MCRVRETGYNCDQKHWRNACSNYVCLIFDHCKYGGRRIIIYIDIVKSVRVRESGLFVLFVWCLSGSFKLCEVIHNSFFGLFNSARRTNCRIFRGYLVINYLTIIENYRWRVSGIDKGLFTMKTSCWNVKYPLPMGSV